MSLHSAWSDGGASNHDAAEKKTAEPSSSSKKLIFAPGISSPAPASAPAASTSSSEVIDDTATSAHRAAQFHLGTLHLHDLSPDPFTQFHAWFTDPRLAGTVPETCTLSTAHLPSGRVSARMVYLKELEASSSSSSGNGGGGGFVIYSNWDTSTKAHDLASNPLCSLTFWWKAAERQVRVEGRAERLSRAESQVYFDTRARGSRLGAWASRQSAVLKPKRLPPSEGSPPAQAEDDDGREQLEEWVQAEEKRWQGKDHIECPDFWGGLRIVPDMIEFWQGRESRLHDRFRYEKVVGGGGQGDGDGGVVEGEGGWKIERLSP